MCTRGESDVPRRTLLTLCSLELSLLVEHQRSQRLQWQPHPCSRGPLWPSCLIWFCVSGGEGQLQEPMSHISLLWISDAAWKAIQGIGSYNYPPCCTDPPFCALLDFRAPPCATPFPTSLPRQSFNYYVKICLVSPKSFKIPS